MAAVTSCESTPKTFSKSRFRGGVLSDGLSLVNPSFVAQVIIKGLYTS